MTDASVLGRLNGLLKENHLLHAIVGAIVVFAVRIGYDVYTGSEPAIFEAIGSGVILGVVYYGGLKFSDSNSGSE